MISMFASLAAIGLTLAAPATTTQDTAATGAAAAAAANVPAPIARPKLFCIVEAPTGTRVPQRTCLTRKQWEARGVDLGQN